MQRWYAANRDRVCETQRKVRERNPEAIRARDRERGFRGKYEDQARAHNAVKTALRNGTLVRESCEVCGESKVIAHHDDYARPLDVRWLCHRHHGEEHRNPLIRPF